VYVTKTPTEHEASRVGLFSESTRKLDDVVARNLPMFYRIAFRYLGNVPDAEDAVQDALVSAYKHLAQFRGQAQMSTWLSAIVTNAALMQLRRRRDIHLSLDQQHGEEGLVLSERLPDSKPTPEEACFASDAHSRILKVINQLSPKLRRTFQLRDLDGLTTKETASLLGVPEGTVKAQIARARAKLVRIIRRKPRRQSSPRVCPDTAVFQANSLCR
jgi:RNA polymerase sigma-70 factor (ECF subfamily)